MESGLLVYTTPITFTPFTLSLIFTPPTSMESTFVWTKLVSHHNFVCLYLEVPQDLCTACTCALAWSSIRHFFYLLVVHVMPVLASWFLLLFLFFLGFLLHEVVTKYMITFVMHSWVFVVSSWKVVLTQNNLRVLDLGWNPACMVRSFLVMMSVASVCALAQLIIPAEYLMRKRTIAPFKDSNKLSLSFSSPGTILNS